MKQMNYNDILGIMNEKLADGGVFLNVGGDKPNTMTIGWAYMGTSWRRNIFIAMVRPQRHTFDILEKTGEFSEKTNSNYWSDLFYGFRPSVVKENSMLYLALVAICIYNIAIQVFFPYLFVYLGSVIIPGAVFDVKTIIVAVLAVAGLAAGVILLLKASGKDKVKAYIITIVLFIAGLSVLSTSTNIAVVLIGIAPTLIGYVVLQIQLNASVRDYIPEDKVGLFQGIRMIFFVLIPMVVGPWLGDIACRTSNFTIIEYGEEKLVPSTSMFFYAAVVSILIFVPLYLLMGKDKNGSKDNKGKFIPAIIVAVITVIVAAVVVNLLGNSGATPTDLAPGDIVETTAALLQ